MKNISRNNIINGRYPFSESTWRKLTESGALRTVTAYQKKVPVEDLEYFEMSRSQFPAKYIFVENAKYIGMRDALDRLGYTGNSTDYTSISYKLQEILNPVNYGAEDKTYRMVREDLLDKAVTYRNEMKNEGTKKAEEVNVPEIETAKNEPIISVKTQDDEPPLWIQLCIPSYEAGKLREIAKSENLSVDDLIAKIIEDALDDARPAEDIIRLAYAIIDDAMWYSRKRGKSDDK